MPWLSVARIVGPLVIILALIGAFLWQRGEARQERARADASALELTRERGRAEANEKALNDALSQAVAQADAVARSAQERDAIAADLARLKEIPDVAKDDARQPAGAVFDDLARRLRAKP